MQAQAQARDSKIREEMSNRQIQELVNVQNQQSHLIEQSSAELQKEKHLALESQNREQILKEQLKKHQEDLEAERKASARLRAERDAANAARISLLSGTTLPGEAPGGQNAAGSVAPSDGSRRGTADRPDLVATSNVQSRVSSDPGCDPRGLMSQASSIPAGSGADALPSRAKATSNPDERVV